VVCGLDSFTLEDVPVTHAIRKTYPLTDELETLQALDWVGVADVTGLVGMAGVRIEAWNRRAVLCHLYVAPQSRGKGIGGSLVSAAIAAARARAARCLWVETQTTNVGAVRFYERMGFKWCGFDTALYDPNHVRPDEVALFFVREF
jgi:ribosomal protein S18 acetylase RimI-like enzyme